MYKNHLLSLFGLLLIILCMASCSPAYIPNVINVPMMRRAGEVQLSGYKGTNGWDLQSAVGVAKHIAFVANTSYANVNNVGSDSTSYHHHSFVEGGIGYYNSPDSPARVEIYGGYGRGNSSNKENYSFIGSTKEVIKGFYERYYLQCNVGVSRKVVNAGGCVRLAEVRFYKFNDNYSNIINNDVTRTFLEPAGFVQIGGGIAKFETQIGLSIPLSPNTNSFNNQPFYFTVGVHFYINRRESNKASSSSGAD